MNKTFNINLGGFPFSIDDDAFVYVENYLASIRRHFSNSEGCEEILYDIEVRMAELFSEHLRSRTIISMKEVDEVVRIMGKPEDFGAEPISNDNQGSQYKGTGSFDSKIGVGKRLFRDEDNKVMAGVCSGIAAYLGVEDPLWIRLIFVTTLPIGGFGVLLYFILWFAVPKAVTAGDKLAMRGEPTTINNIAKVIEDEFDDLGGKITEWGNSINTKKKSSLGFSASAITGGMSNILALGGGIVLSILTGIFKIVKPIVKSIGVLGMVILIILLSGVMMGLGYAAPVLVDMGPDNALMSYLGYLAGIAVIIIPIFALVMVLIRYIFGYKLSAQIRRPITMVFLAALVTMFLYGIMVLPGYSAYNSVSTSMVMRLKGNKLTIIEKNDDLAQNFTVNFGNAYINQGNNWASNNVNVQVENNSLDSLVHITKIASSRGSSPAVSQKYAERIQGEFEIVNDNTINYSYFLNFPKSDKIRHQKITYKIQVPEWVVVDRVYE